MSIDSKVSRLLSGPSFDMTGYPEWWTAGSREAWQKFESLPMPSRKDEDWRFASIRSIQLEDYQFMASAPTPDAELPELELDALARACFINGKTASFATLPEEYIAQGVIWKSLAQAVVDHPELIQNYLMKHEQAQGDRKFAQLHRAFVQTGSVIVVPDNVQLDKPLIAEYWLDGENASVFPHTLIVAGKNSTVTVVDSFRSTSDAKGLACAVNDVHVGEGAKVSYLCAQEWNENTLSFQYGATHTEKDGHVKSFHYNSGGGFSRLETVSRSVGSGARSEMMGLSMVHGRQEFDQRTLQLHEAPHTWSDLLFKNSLNHRAKSIFSGLIKVSPGAFQTDAYQTNRNLLLDPLAEADSMPGLEIANDDVKCSHGATTSQIEEESLFYMQARGISEASAKHLIAIGFCAELLEKFDNEAISELLIKRIEEK
ncbi:MAG: Fe-S cluster assembly protein SufD, partial [Verrucomicrobiota bacterium]